jgi:hypothetical protein
MVWARMRPPFEARCSEAIEDPVNRLSQSLSSAQQARDARRGQRVARRRMEREVLDLASTPAGRRELDAIMRRHTAEETRELEDILTRVAS